MISISSKVRLSFVYLAVMLYAAGCSELNKAPDTDETGRVVYLNDIKEIFDSKCILCHSGDNPAGEYDMTAYDSVVTRATAGDSSSVLVVKSIEGGSMYDHYKGSDEEVNDVVRWVVVDSLAKE